MSTVLIVDDEPLNRDLMKLLVEALGQDVTLAASGADALTQVAARAPDLVILDVLMPGIDGYEVARRLKADKRMWAVPIIMVSALDDRESKVKGLAAGADDFLTRPVDRIELKVRVQNLLRMKQFQDQLAEQAAILDRKVKLRSEELERSNRETIRTLIRIASYKDDESGAHVKRISLYTMQLAQRMGQDAEFCAAISFASQLHDVGKVAIPERILDKPAPLSSDEWKVMKTHAELGAQMLSQHSSPYLAMAADIARSHHERWSGGGYPSNLKGDAIPVAARITQLCDTYDVLRSRRPYKIEMDHASAASCIIVGDSKTQPEHFDPVALAAFKSSVATFRDIFEAVRD